VEGRKLRQRYAARIMQTDRTGEDRRGQDRNRDNNKVAGQNTVTRS